MCEELIIERDGQWQEIDDLGDLRAALPGCVVIDHRYSPDLPDNNCLCCVDMGATAAKARLRAMPPRGIEWAWRFVA